MKQHITIHQLNELSDKGKEKLRDWWEPDLGDLYIREIDFLEIEKFNKFADMMNRKLTEAEKSTGRKQRYFKHKNIEDINEKYDVEQVVIKKITKKARNTSVFPLLSIGQMIEFLMNNVMGEPYDLELHINNAGSSLRLGLTEKKIIGSSYIDNSEDPQVVDTLWQAVKNVLEKL